MLMLHQPRHACCASEALSPTIMLFTTARKLAPKARQEPPNALTVLPTLARRHHKVGIESAIVRALSGLNIGAIALARPTVGQGAAQKSYVLVAVHVTMRWSTTSRIPR